MLIEVVSPQVGVLPRTDLELSLTLRLRDVDARVRELPASLLKMCLVDNLEQPFAGLRPSLREWQQQVVLFIPTMEKSASMTGAAEFRLPDRDCPPRSVHGDPPFLANPNAQHVLRFRRKTIISPAPGQREVLDTRRAPRAQGSLMVQCTRF